MPDQDDIDVRRRSPEILVIDLAGRGRATPPDPSNGVITRADFAGACRALLRCVFDLVLIYRDGAFDDADIAMLTKLASPAQVIVRAVEGAARTGGMPPAPPKRRQGQTAARRPRRPHL